MKRKKFRIIAEPQKPVRKKNVKYTNYIWDGESLGYLSGWLEEHGATLEDVTIEKEWGYYDEVSIQACIKVDELEKDFQQRVKYYEIKKKKYDKWYKDNKKAIKEELKIREVEEAEQTKKNREALKKRKEKEKAQLEKDIARLNKKLKKLK